MNKLNLFTLFLITTLLSVSCVNKVTNSRGSRGSKEVFATEADKEATESFLGTVYTPQMTYNGKTSYSWDVKSGDEVTLKGLWRNVVGAGKGSSVILAYSPIFDGTGSKRAYFDKDLNIVSYKDHSILQKFKGVKIVKINEKDNYQLKGKYTLAGVYTVVKPGFRKSNI